MKHEDFIKLFQRRGGLTSDAIVGPATLALLDRLLPVTAAIVAHARIPMTHILGAIKAEATYGVPASVSLAQWAVESGWGKFMPAGSNNPFGMKARANETGPVVVSRTREVHTSGPKKGQEYYIDAAFRKFDSIEHAFVEHAKLVGTAPVYAAARAKLPDVNAYVDEMAKRYATDPQYAATLKSVMRSNDLYRYDKIA